MRGPERRQQVIEQRDRGARVDGGALPEGLLPPGLESRGQFLAHLLRGVGVQAAHSRDLVSKPLLGQDLGDAVLDHPRLVAVPELLARMYLVEESGQDRYSLHDLLRLYAAECSSAEDTDEGRAAARRRLLDWYLHTAYAANSAIIRLPRFALDAAAEGCVPLTFATIRRALDWCETEHANLMASVRMAAETGHHVAAWQIPATL